MSREALERAWELVLKSGYLPCGECKQTLGPNDLCPSPKTGHDHLAKDCFFWDNTQATARLRENPGFAFSSIDGANELQIYDNDREGIE